MEIRDHRVIRDWSGRNPDNKRINITSFCARFQRIQFGNKSLSRGWNYPGTCFFIWEGLDCDLLTSYAKSSFEVVTSVHCRGRWWRHGGILSHSVFACIMMGWPLGRPGVGNFCETFAVATWVDKWCKLGQTQLETCHGLHFVDLINFWIGICLSLVFCLALNKVIQKIHFFFTDKSITAASYTANFWKKWKIATLFQVTSKYIV